MPVHESLQRLLDTAIFDMNGVRSGRLSISTISRSSDSSRPSGTGVGIGLPTLSRTVRPPRTPMKRHLLGSVEDRGIRRAPGARVLGVLPRRVACTTHAARWGRIRSSSSRQAPSSGHQGARAIITADGDMHGWIGGACAEPVVIREAQRVIEDRQPRLILLGTPDQFGELPEGMTFVQMSCQSEGALQLYVEPVLNQSPLPQSEALLSTQLRQAFEPQKSSAQRNPPLRR